MSFNINQLTIDNNKQNKLSKIWNQYRTNIDSDLTNQNKEINQSNHTKSNHTKSNNNKSDYCVKKYPDYFTKKCSRFFNYWTKREDIPDWFKGKKYWSPDKPCCSRDKCEPQIMKPIKHYKTRWRSLKSDTESTSNTFKLIEFFYIIQYISLVLAIYFKLKTGLGFYTLIGNFLSIFIVLLYIILLVCTIMYNIKASYTFSKSERRSLLKSWMFSILNCVLFLLYSEIESPLEIN